MAKVRAVLLIAQGIRFDPKEESLFGPKPTRPREVLKEYARAVTEAFSECDLSEPEPAYVRHALGKFGTVSEAEVEQLVAEMPS